MDPQSTNNGRLDVGQTRPMIAPTSPPIDAVLAPGAPQDSVHSVVPTGAADSDSIEHEWVKVTKTRMRNNRDNPFEQNEAMSFLRAEYISKRYNKVVKVPKGR